MHLIQVKFYQPQWEAESWFNIFMCHQNRAQRGVLKYLPEEAIPPFIDFVIWGHEHESRIRLEFNEVGRFHVTQPGKLVLLVSLVGRHGNYCFFLFPSE